MRTAEGGAPSEIVIVGEKPVMNYVVACLTLFNAGAEEVRVRGRGRHITRTVDIVETLRRIFLRDLEVEAAIGTDRFKGEDGRETSVSIIELKLVKTKEPAHP